MNLVVSDALAKEILRIGRTDAKLLRALAKEWVDRIEPAALHAFLLGGGVDVDLLAQRLKSDPDRTLSALARLEAGGRAEAQPARRTTTAKRGPKAAAATPLARPRKGKRVRLSKGQVDKLKAAVVSFLGAHAWSTRKQISDAANIPTPSLYNRLIAELRADKRLQAKGEKAKRVYALASDGARAAKPAVTAAKPAAKPAAKGKQRKAAKRA